MNISQVVAFLLRRPPRFMTYHLHVYVIIGFRIELKIYKFAGLCDVSNYNKSKALWLIRELIRSRLAR